MGAPVARAALGVQRLGGTDDRIQSTANREKLSDEKIYAIKLSKNIPAEI
jgi:hypothetical protein